MNAEGHLKRGEEIRKSIEVLKDDENHVSSIVELVYGCALHYIAYGCEKRFGVHQDLHNQLIRFLRDDIGKIAAGATSLHNQLIRFLRERGEDEIALLFSELDTLRHGRWYGGKGDGETVVKVLEILDAIRRWKDKS